MSDEQQGEEKKRVILFQDATAGVPTEKQQAMEQMVQERIEAFGKDLQAVIEKHNADYHFAATDADILTEVLLSMIGVWKFGTQSRDYRLYSRMAKASAEGKLDQLK